MKKYLSLIAVLALLVACMIPAAFAAEITATIGSKEVAMGEGTVQVELPVTTGEIGVAAGQFDGLSVTGDAKIVEIKDGAIGTMYNDGSVVLLNLKGVDVTGVLFYIVVEVPVSAPATYTVSFTAAEGTSVSANMEGAAISVAAGTITVTHECVAGEWEIVKEPTCTEAGEKVQKCTLCDKVLKTEAIPALGHKEEVIAAVAATCTETGLTEGKKCSVCNEILVKQETVAALGHDWKDAGVANEGAYNCPDEKMNQKCSRCDATQVVAHPHECEEAVFVLSNVYDAEKKANVTTKQVRCIHSGDKGHGCTALDGEPWTEEVKDPITGDITPYIAMAALTLVAMVSAAAYLLKRKAI